jgi:hypothetical protein
LKQYFISWYNSFKGAGLEWLVGTHSLKGV